MPQLLTFAVALLVVVVAAYVPAAALVAPAAFVAVIASLSRDDGPIARVFKTRAAQYLGRLSYSLYLGHAVLYGLFTLATDVTKSKVARVTEAALFVLLSFALAHALARFVETPWRRRVNAFADVAFRSPSSSRSAALARHAGLHKMRPEQ